MQNRFISLENDLKNPIIDLKKVKNITPSMHSHSTCNEVYIIQFEYSRKFYTIWKFNTKEERDQKFIAIKSLITNVKL